MDDKKVEKPSIKLEVITILIGLVGVGVAVLCFESGAETWIGVIFLIIGGLFLLLGRGSLDAKNKRKKQAEEQRKAENERIALISSGQWEFPKEEFFARCKEAGFDRLDAAFYSAKAKLIADDILKANKVPEEYYPLYDSADCLEAYLEHGRNADAQEAARLEEEKRHPHEAVDGTEEQADALVLQAQLEEVQGIKKRSIMLTHILSVYSHKIDGILAAQKAMETLGVILASSAAETKTRSWATEAGIAAGLAGPVAGALVGADAMLENQRIEEQNRQNREAVNKVATDIFSGSFKMSSDVSDLEKEKAVFEQAKKDAASKVVLTGIDAQELFDSLKITRVKVQEDNNHVLKVSAMMTSSYIPQGVPENVKMTVDGTLFATVRAGDMIVDRFVLPLPLYGVECGSKTAVKAETFCDKYSINGQPYKVSFEPNRLWVMEV